MGIEPRHTTRDEKKTKMTQSASATNVGAGKAPSKASSPKAGTVRNRKGTSATTVTRRTAGGGGQPNMWRFYTEDSTGIKVGPVPVLVMSLLFIASVFMLHIWGSTPDLRVDFEVREIFEKTLLLS